jgi:hypothetical protein
MCFMNVCYSQIEAGTGTSVLGQLLCTSHDPDFLSLNETLTKTVQKCYPKHKHM